MARWCRSLLPLALPPVLALATLNLQLRAEAQDPTAILQSKLQAMPQQVPGWVKVADVRISAEDGSLARAGGAWRELAEVPRLAYPLAQTAEAMDPWGWRYSDRRGAWRMHTGVDLAVDQGTPVLAALAGRVVLVETISGYGLTVLVDHGDGWQTLYAHLHGAVAVASQWLEQGEVLGTVGMTGQSSGPHLHFELRRQGSDLLALDPTPHLPPLLPPPSLPPVLATISP